METVAVRVWFEQGKIRPERFVWRNREYEVKRITIQFQRSDGGRKFLCFGVDTGGMLAELRMDRENFQFSIHNFQPAV